MNAFLTGSRVYGTPRPDSDIDLVILVDGLTGDALELLKEGDGAIRFGRLNLIACYDKQDFLNWKKGTDQLREIARLEGPVTREQARKHLRRVVGDQEGKSGGDAFDRMQELLDL